MAKGDMFSRVGGRKKRQVQHETEIVNETIVFYFTDTEAKLQSDDPTCERCLQEDESATHTLCDCEAVAHLRFRHLGQLFMEPSDFYEAPIFRVLHFIRSVGLIRD
jgi:hypothetical protein